MRFLLGMHGLTGAVIFVFVTHVHTDVSYVGRTKNDVFLQTTTLQIRNFETVNSEGIFQTSSGDFVFQSSGIHFVSCVLLAYVTHPTNVLKLLVNFNQEAIRSSTVQSWSETAFGRTSLKISALIRANANDVFRVYLHSQSSGTVLKKDSELAVLSLSLYDTYPSFFVQMRNDVFIKATESQFFWTSLAGFASFTTTNLFTRMGGFFVALDSGLYVAVGNFIFSKIQPTPCSNNVSLVRDSRQVLVASSMSISKLQKYLTNNFIRIVHLAKGDRLRVFIESSCPVITLSKRTTFGVAFLSNARGYSASVTEALPNIPRENWSVLNIKEFATSNQTGGAVTEHVEAGSDLLSFPEASQVLLTVNLRFRTAQNTSNIKVAITKNVEALQIQDKDFLGDGFALAYQCSLSVMENTIGFSAVITVEKNDHLRINVYYPRDDKYYILPASAISAVVLRSADRKRTKRRKRFTSNAKQWKLVDSCEIDHEMVRNDAGVFRFYRSSVFYMTASASIRDYPLDDELQMAVIYNRHDMSREKIPLTAKESSFKYKTTLKVASVLYVNNEDSVGVYVKSERQSSFTVKCRTAVVILGYKSSVVGFQANLENSITIKQAGTSEIRNFYDPGRTSVSQMFDYNVGDCFSHKRGSFIAPHSGVYLISVNFIVQDLQTSNSKAHVSIFISINGRPSTYATKKTASSDSENTHVRFSLTLSGPIELRKNDVIKMVATSNSNEEWSVDRYTSFSVVLLDEDESANGFLSNNPRVQMGPSNDQRQVIYGWSTNNLRDGRFHYASSAMLKNSEEILFERAGVYVLSVVVHLTDSDIPKDYTLGFGKVDGRPLLCNELSSTYIEIGLSCEIILKCEKGDRYNVQVSTRGGVSSLNIVASRSESIEEAILSVYRMPDEKGFQASSFMLKSDIRLGGSWSAIKSWQMENYAPYCGTCGFQHNDGVLTAYSTGWYFISLALKYKYVAGYTNLTITRSTVKNTDDIMVATSQSGKELLKLNMVGIVHMSRGDTLSVSIRSSATLPANESTLSYTYIPEQGVDGTVRYTKQNSMTVAKEGKINEWRASNQKLSTDDFLCGSGLYVVTGNIIVTSPSATYVTFGFRSEGNDLFASRYYILPNTMFTFLLAGAFVIKSSRTFLSLYMQCKHSTTIHPPSSLSLIYLGPPNLAAIFLRVVSPGEHHWIVNKWLALTSFHVQQRTKFYYQNNMIVPQISGLYFISAHVIASAQAPLLLGVALFLNDETVLTSFERLNNTHSVSRNVYLRKGSRVQLKVMSSSEMGFRIDVGSTFTVALIESFEHSKDVWVPVVTSELIAGGILELSTDMELTLECNVVAKQPIRYRWFRDNEEISGHTENVLLLYGAKSGLYQCQATSNNVGPMSTATKVIVNEVNECLDDENCNGANMTCVDTSSSYRCDCLHDLSYYGGQCVETTSAPSPIPPLSDATVPVALLILIPMSCLTLILLVICTVFVCMRRRRAREDVEEDIETQALSQNEQEIALQSLHASLTDIRDPVSSESLDLSSTATTYSATNAQEDDNDVGGFEEYRWRKLADATTTV